MKGTNCYLYIISRRLSLNYTIDITQKTYRENKGCILNLGSCIRDRENANFLLVKMLN